MEGALLPSCQLSNLLLEREAVQPIFLHTAENIQYQCWQAADVADNDDDDDDHDETSEQMYDGDRCVHFCALQCQQNMPIMNSTVDKLKIFRIVHQNEWN